MDVYPTFEAAAAVLAVSGAAFEAVRRWAIPASKRRRAALVTEVTEAVTTAVKHEVTREIGGQFMSWGNALDEHKLQTVAAFRESHEQLAEGLRFVRHELEHNSGGSVKDAVKRIETNQRSDRVTADSREVTFHASLTEIAADARSAAQSAEAAYRISRNTAERVDRLEGGAVHA